MRFLIRDAHSMAWSVILLSYDRYISEKFLMSKDDFRQNMTGRPNIFAPQTGIGPVAPALIYRTFGWLAKLARDDF